MRDISRSFRFCIFAALLLMLAPFTYSQTITTADTVGVVSDPSGATVGGATITITDVQRNISRTITTDASLLPT